MKRGVLVLTVLSLSWVTAMAQWTLDKSHSNVLFTVRHMMVSEVIGYFKEFDVTLASSKADFTDAVIEASVKTASVNTDNESRDKDLKSDNFFSADKFPEMKFKSNKIEKTGANTYKITGDLTIRDVTKEVTFDATLFGTIATGRDTRAGWKATATVNRFDYGLKWNRMIESGGLVVNENVLITLNCEFKKPK